MGKERERDYSRGPDFLFQGASPPKYKLNSDLRWPAVHQAKCGKSFLIWGKSMCEALEIGRDLVHFLKKKKAGVSSVVSKESGEWGV